MAEGLPDIAEIKQRFGEHAAEYASVRKETAQKLGDCMRAQYWQLVEDRLRSEVDA
jgi:hypothetical protein